MQPESSAVQKTPFPDSPPTDSSPIQYGNDSEAGPVSGALHPERHQESTGRVWSTPEQNDTPLKDTGSTPPSAHRVSQYEDACMLGRKNLEPRLQVLAGAQSKIPFETLPNEVLTHILSHLPPQSLSDITLVSRRLHSLVTTPHAWRSAFSRFFPGPQALEDARSVDLRNSVDQASDRRYFARLTALASWRSEYILRTRLMRSLSRGKPVEFPSKKPGPVHSATSRNGSAVSTYTSQLLFPVSRMHGSFNNPEKGPTFIHGASEQGIASASDPAAVKVSSWGLSDHQMFRHFADMFPGDAPYGLGAGEMVGTSNSMDVSQPYGMIYGEGCPQGRSYFISSTEQRGRFLGISDLGSHPKSGIPASNMITHAICSVWIAKSSSILKTTGGLVAMMTGSSSGLLTAYALGPHPTYGKRYERGQVTARWVLCPGVPIIGIAIDDNYSPSRNSQHRVWAVVLNALGEIFYLTDLPIQPEVSSTSLTAEQYDELAWKTGRSVRWELVELSRRTARPDPFNRELVDGSYSPRTSSDSMRLSEDQIAAETKEIEKFLSFKPKHFRKVCEGWNMQRDLQVDFAGDDGRGSGESVIVIARGADESEKASIRRYIRATPKSDVKSVSGTSYQEQPRSLFGGPIGSSTPASIPASPSSGRLHGPAQNDSEWKISNFVFGDRKSVEVTISALDNSMFATLAMGEDPLLAMSQSSFSSATSSPMLPHMEQPRSSLEVPGQRARYLAVGTASGSIYIWDIRALAARNVDVINSVSPLRIIQTDSPQISCVALTSLYLVHGGNDGLVQAWDPLASTTRPIRTINSRFSSRARRRLVQAEATMHGVGNNFFAAGAISLDPDPTILRGMVSLGTHLRYWSYSSSGADQYKSNKRRLRHTLRGNNAAGGGQRFNTSGRGAIHDFIADEQVEIERQKIEDDEKHAHLSTRFGVDLLGPDIDEEQLLAYAQLLSQEAYSGNGQKGEQDQPTIASSVSTSLSDHAGPSPFGIDEMSSSSSPYQEPADDTDVDDDLAEAIRLSLLNDKPDTSAPIDQTPSIPIKYAKGVKRHSPSPSIPDGESSRQKEMDDLEFAIQLSLAEDQSREIQEWEEFPVLPPGSSQESSNYEDKGKGKARAI